MNDEQTGKVLELVVFVLKEAPTREQFMGTVDSTSGWIRSQPGFVSYDLSHSAEEDKWVFAAWWRTMQQAKIAAEAAMSAPGPAWACASGGSTTKTSRPLPKRSTPPSAA